MRKALLSMRRASGFTLLFPMITMASAGAEPMTLVRQTMRNEGIDLGASCIKAIQGLCFEVEHYRTYFLRKH